MNFIQIFKIQHESLENIRLSLLFSLIYQEKKINISNYNKKIELETRETMVEFNKIGLFFINIHK